MYIDPFLAGVLSTVFIELVVGMVIIIRIGWEQN